MSRRTSISTENFVIEDSILSYPHLFTPEQVNGKGDPKFSGVLLPPMSVGEMIHAKAVALVEEGIKQGVLPPNVTNMPNFRWPVTAAADKINTKGEYPYRGNPRLEGRCCFNITASQDYPPQIVDENRNPVMDRGKIYAGCVVAAGIRLYTYNNAGNMGVAVGFSAIMKTGDGEPLGGETVDVNTLFGGVQAQPSAGNPASPNGAPAPTGQSSSPFGQPTQPADSGMPSAPFGQPDKPSFM